MTSKLRSCANLLREIENEIGQSCTVKAYWQSLGVFVLSAVIQIKGEEKEFTRGFSMLEIDKILRNDEVLIKRFIQDVRKDFKKG